MRTSNKWLISTVVASIFVMIGANLLLFRQLRHGKVASFQDERNARSSRLSLPPIHYLVLDGTTWVNIIPGDSNILQMADDDGEPNSFRAVVFGPKSSGISNHGPVYRLAGDTLYITGNNQQPLHRPYIDWFYRMSIHQINVYASALENIQVSNGQVLLKGRPDSLQHTSMALEARNSTIWMGEMDMQPEGTRHKKLPDEFFDSISLRLYNTVLLLNKPSIVTDLHARLDSGSEINDRSATLGRSRISASPESRISFTGNNITTTTITTE